MVVFFIVALWLPLQKSDACSGILLKGSSSSTLPPSGCSQRFFSNSVGSLPYSMMNSEKAVSVNSCYKNKVNWQQVNNKDQRVAGSSIRNSMRSWVICEGQKVDPLSFTSKGHLRWFRHLTTMPPGHLLGGVLQTCPTVRKPHGRPMTCWRDYISQLAWVDIKPFFILPFTFWSLCGHAKSCKSQNKKTAEFYLLIVERTLTET